MPAIYHEGSWLGNATDPEVLVKDTVGWTGKNKFPLTLSNLKSINTSGTWNGNSYTHNNVTYTITAENDIVTNIASSGTASTSGGSNLFLWANGIPSWMDADKDYILSGCASDGSASTYSIQYNNWTEGATYQKIDNGNGVTIRKITDSTTQKIRIWIRQNVDASGLNFKPMVRDASITDPTYEPYHESVEVMYEEEIHGVNLFSNSISGLATSGGAVGTTNFSLVEGATAFYGKVQRNKNYTITKAGGDRFRVCLSNEVPANRVPCNIIANADGNSYTFNSGNYDYVYLLASMTSQTIDVIKPMLRKADIDDSTYRPYNPQAIQNQLNDKGVLGAKNLLPNNATSQTINGVTFTVNADGSVTANGTATAVANFNISLSISDKLSCILNGCPSGGSDNSYRIGARYNNSGTLTYNYDTGSGCGINDISIVDRIFIQIANGQTVNNLVFKPMLRLASDPDDTYVPHAMTNRELTEKAFLIQPYVPSTGDLDNVKTTGIYGIFDAPTHSPERANYCTLLVNRVADNNILQVVFRRNTIYTRAYINGTWYNWFKYAGTELT